MKSKSKKSTPPALTGAPKVMQARRIGEDANRRGEPPRNDDARPNPSGSFESEKSRKYSKGQRIKKKKKKKVY